MRALVASPLGFLVGLALGALGQPLLATGPAQAEPAHASLGLTAREVLRLLAAGYTNPQIGDALYISRNTASHHVSSVLTKLRVTTRVGCGRRPPTGPHPRHHRTEMGHFDTAERDESTWLCIARCRLGGCRRSRGGAGPVARLRLLRRARGRPNKPLTQTGFVWGAHINGALGQPSRRRCPDADGPAAAGGSVDSVFSHLAAL
jgi:DNA-binding CsgD family transcriptional regulator